MRNTQYAIRRQRYVGSLSIPPRVLNFVTRTTIEQHKFSIVRGSLH